MLGTDGEYQLPTRKASFDSCARKLQTISCKLFHRKTYFTQFREFDYNILSKIAGRIKLLN